MKTIIPVIRPLVLSMLLLASFVGSTVAQEVSIPDPGLNAAIREALQKPSGPLAEQDLLSLTNLDACCRNISSVEGLGAARNLSGLDLGSNHLSNLTLPVGLTNLTGLNLSENQLTNVVLPPDLNYLESLNLGGNQLTRLTLPAGLTNLVGVFVTGNQLTTLTLPPDMTQVIGFGFLGNPLTTVVLSEPLAATNLAADVASLRNQGVSVFTYPLAAQLVRPLMLIGAFKFGITGLPGVYTVLGSTNLAAWSTLGVATNPLGSVNFVDVTANASPQKFYRVLLQVPPANMEFIPPNTFTMGRPDQRTAPSPRKRLSCMTSDCKDGETINTKAQ
jgi:hypothetical protein